MSGHLAIAEWSDVCEHEHRTGDNLEMHWFGGRHAFRVFDKHPSAIAFQLKVRCSLQVLPIVGNWAEPLLQAAVDAQKAVQRRFASGVKLDRDFIDNLLVAMTPNKWFSERNLMTLTGRGLTPFEWQALVGHHYFRIGARKTGNAYRLSKDGESRRSGVLRRRKFDQEMRERRKEHERSMRAHDAVMAEIDAQIAALLAKRPRAKAEAQQEFAERLAPNVIYLGDGNPKPSHADTSDREGGERAN